MCLPQLAKPQPISDDAPSPGAAMDIIVIILILLLIFGGGGGLYAGRGSGWSLGGTNSIVGILILVVVVILIVRLLGGL